MESSRGTELIVAGDFNVELDKMSGRGWNEEIVAAVAMAGLGDLLGHLLLRQRVWCKVWMTWAVVTQGRVVRSRMYYILGSECWILQNVAFREQRNRYDDIMVLG